MKQITGIEPASSAWEADVLPMNYICIRNIFYCTIKERRIQPAKEMSRNPRNL